MERPPDPFEEMDAVDAARREESGMSRSEGTGIGLHRSRPLGILPTGAWARVRKVIGGRFRLGKKGSKFEAPVAPGTRPLWPEKDTGKRD